MTQVETQLFINLTNRNYEEFRLTFRRDNTSLRPLGYIIRPRII